jgi:hypothetical protein
MSDEETVTKYRCSRCQRTFEDAYDADQHDHKGTEAEIHAVEVREGPETEPTTLGEWGFENASERADQEADDE